jgi:ABC-2 type transport system permease protein
MARGVLDVPIRGSILLFLSGAIAFLFATMALGVMLATLTPSMPQFALLAFPSIIVMEVLSGGMTPLESMPAPLQLAMSAVPSTHYVQFAQSVLFREASLPLVWPQIATMAGLGVVYVAIALMRFRRMLTKANGS